MAEAFIVQDQKLQIANQFRKKKIGGINKQPKKKKKKTESLRTRRK
jgi:hypothetical protein